VKWSSGRQWFSLGMVAKALLRGAHEAPFAEGVWGRAVEAVFLSDDKLAFVGFSQGTMMGLCGPYAISCPGGVVGFSGSLIGDEGIRSRRSALSMANQVMWCLTVRWCLRRPRWYIMEFQSRRIRAMAWAWYDGEG